MRIIFESQNLTISSTVSRKNTPSLDGVFFQSMKDAVLGKKYELSLVFIGRTLARTLNRKHRKKDYPTDILSFTLESSASTKGIGSATGAGEIFIYPQKARTKAKEFDRTFENYLKFLFIHGMYHLKGFDHENENAAAKMERAEVATRKKFGV